MAQPVSTQMANFIRRELIEAELDGLEEQHQIIRTVKRMQAKDSGLSREDAHELIAATLDCLV
jgi:hypothetical protein